MKEKILAFLKTKLTGVPETYLLGVAEHYSKTVTEDSQIATTFTDGVVDLLKLNAGLLQTEGDKRATEASKTALKTFREKHGLNEDGTLVKKEDKKEDKTDPNEIIVKLLTDALKPLQDKIASIEGDKRLTSRKAALESKLVGVNEIIKAKVLKDFGRMNFESNEDFDKYLTETTTDVADLIQKDAEGKIIVSVPPNGGGITDGKVSPEVTAYLEEKMPLKK